MLEADLPSIWGLKGLFPRGLSLLKEFLGSESKATLIFAKTTWKGSMAMTPLPCIVKVYHDYTHTHYGG